MTGTEELYRIYQQYPTICTDTRKLEKDCLFFALKGANFNGNKFAAQARAEGAAYVIIDEPEFAVDANCLLVTDVLKALQDLATFHRRQLNIPVVAIVGSNGKTTTKELISHVLQTRFHILFTPGNFNNHIGLPLTLLMLKKEHEIAVIEMGANHQLENALLCNIARPSHGIVTNNGKDHLEGFGSLEGVIRSNAELYDYLRNAKGTAFVNENDAVLMHESAAIQNRILYGRQESESVSANRIALKENFFQPHISFNIQGLTIESVLSGDYNFDNILAALAIGLHFGLNKEELKKGIESYKPQNLRSQLIEKENNRIFLDAYNANPSSMEVSIRNFAAMPGQNKLLILGDMFEMGEYEAREHQAIAEYCTGLGLTDVWLAGKAFSAVQSDYLKFESTEAIENYLREHPLKNRFVFLKGSRGMKLEKLTELL